MNLRRLNYILIPHRPETLERWQASWAARLTWPLAWFFLNLTTEGRTLFVAMLVAGTAGLDIRFSSLYLVFCGLAGLLAAAFLARPLARLPRVRLWMEHPPRVTAGAPVTLTAVVRNEGNRPIYALRLEGPFLPWDGQWESPLPAIPVLDPGQEARVAVTARFLCRGQRVLGRFTVASVRPLGLVRGPGVTSQKVILAVVPRVAQVEPLRLPPATRYQQGGVIQSALAGASPELLGVREYRSGDRMRDLHARSWARLGRPMVREFRQEQFQRIGVILHTQLDRGPEERFDPAVELTAGLVAALAGEEALVDLIVLAERPHALTVGCHVSLLEQALDLLAVIEPGRRSLAAQAPLLLGPHLGRLSAACLVFAGWDAPRAALLEEVRSRGLEVRAFLVAPEQTSRSGTLREPALRAAVAAGVRLWPEAG